MNKRLNLTAEHYLDVYLTRKSLQDEGVTNVSEEIKVFTNNFIEELRQFPLDEKIVLLDNSFYDTKGNLIIKIPVNNP